MKFKNLINLKKFFEYYTVFILLLVYFVGNYHASFYGKQTTNFGTFKMPYGLKLIDFGTDYSINDALGMGIGIITPDAPFHLDKSLYVKQLLGYCILKDRLAVFVRTRENDIKIITLNGKTQILPFNERFTYKIYSPREFYNDTTLFKHDYNYYIPCTSFRGETGVSGSWSFIGNSILFLLFSWILYKVYRLLKKKNQNNFPPTKKK